MLLKLFINNIKTASVAVLIATLTACSSAPDTSSSDDLKGMSTDIVDMVSVPTDSNVNNNQTAQANAVNGNDGTLVSVNPDGSPVIKKHVAVKDYFSYKHARLSGIPESVFRYYDNALSAMKAEEWDKADGILSGITKLYPQLSGVYVNRAIIAQQQGHDDKAMQLLNAALVQNDMNPYAHNLQGLMYRQQGQFDKAEQSYLQAIKAWPKYPEAQLNMAVLLDLYRGQYEDAYLYYQTYLDLKPDDKNVIKWLAAVENKLSAQQQALED